MTGALERTRSEARMVGNDSEGDIQKALLHIDDENAAHRLDMKFTGAVVMKGQLRNQNGKEFRKAFSAANR